MSASTELPRGLWFTNIGISGGQASITLPAVAGIGWALKEVDALYFNNTGAGKAFNINVSPTSPFESDPFNLIVSAAGGAFAKDTDSFSGNIIYPANTAVQIQFNGASAVTGDQQVLNVYAEPV